MPYTFDAFIEVRRTVRAVRQARECVLRGLATNPLFLFGDSGVGKTHLLHAIVTAFVAATPRLRVGLWTARGFGLDVVSAIQHHETAQFRRALRETDLLVVDNLEDFREMPAMQEELATTIADLVSRRRIVLMAANRRPSVMQVLNRRLAALATYQAVRVGAPDLDEREAIVLRRSSERGLLVTPFAARAIAQRATTVGAVDGALRRLQLQASLRSASRVA